VTDDQLSLFPLSRPSARDEADALPRGSDEPLIDAYADVRALAARLPPLLRFGTSSWSFPGWAGIVYRRPRRQADLARDGLHEYARYPLFGTVGIDRSYYAPLTPEDLRRYAAQLPPGFPCCAKVPAMFASPVVATSGRHAPPVPNREFLSADGFIRDVLDPWARWFDGHAGPFILEIPPVPAAARLAPEPFADALFAFLSRLPRTCTCAVELRDRGLLGPRYAEVLAATGAVHVYSYWSAMPMPAVQAQIVPPPDAGPLVIRLLLRPGPRYEPQREAFRPFNRLVEPDEGMRREVVTLLGAAARRQQPAFVLVNNKAEGSAPLTIRALAERVTAETDGAMPSVTRRGSPPVPR
jgi:uncharacterized protein YecE (DUF72 family)